MKIETHNIVDDEDRPFIKINDKNVKTLTIERVRQKQKNTDDTFSKYFATYNIASTFYCIFYENNRNSFSLCKRRY